MSSQYISHVRIHPNLPDVSQFPVEVREIMDTCKLANQAYPAIVTIEHNPNCIIFSDKTVLLRDHDCEPVSVTTTGVIKPNDRLAMGTGGV
jgi:hypothetical protein